MQYFACKIPKFYLDGELIWIAVTLAESEFTTIFWGVGDPWMHQNTQNVPKYYPSVKSYFHDRMGGGLDLLMIQRVSVVWVLDLMKIPEGGTEYLLE